MTPQELKNSILQFAIQGKLVEQRPEEGTAEELYQQIQAEKQALIKAKKIKKDKPLPEITEDEKPFEIPESWKWVRVLDVSYAVGNKNNQIQAKEIGANGKYPVVSQGQALVDGYTNDSSKVIIDLPLVMFGDHTRNVKYIEFPFVIGADGTKFHKCIEVYPKYMYHWMRYAAIKLKNRGYARHYSLLKSEPLPLPPLSEQYRIVAKIEELLPLIDRYEQAWNKLEKLNEQFPVDIQKSILQTAIQGKLVEQRPEDGTGEELYRQIQSEKQRLTKEGKIKKDKLLPEITENEKPFEIPKSWKWCYVGELFSHNTGKAMNSSAKKNNKTGSIRKFITTSNLYWNTFDFSSVKEMFFSDDELDRCTIKKGDLLMNEGGAYFGRTAIWDFDYEICFQNHIHRLRSYKEVELKYFYHVFFFYRNMNMMQSKGTAMPGLSSETLHNMVIPLPPLAEQKRIVAKLEEVLPLCEKLK